MGTDFATAFRPYLQWMSDRGTINPADMNLYTVVGTPEEVAAALESALPRPR